MGFYLLSAETSFSAAHTLPGVESCERFHGHNWNVRVTVRVDEKDVPANGMGLDFREIEKAVSLATSEFDHQYLNEIEPFDKIAPTAENLARLVSERVSHQFSGMPRVSVEEVEIWETPHFKVLYRPQ